MTENSFLKAKETDRIIGKIMKLVIEVRNEYQLSLYSVHFPLFIAISKLLSIFYSKPKTQDYISRYFRKGHIDLKFSVIFLTFTRKVKDLWFTKSNLLIFKRSLQQHYYFFFFFLKSVVKINYFIHETVII